MEDDIQTAKEVIEAAKCRLKALRSTSAKYENRNYDHLTFAEKIEFETTKHDAATAHVCIAKQEEKMSKLQNALRELRQSKTPTGSEQRRSQLQMEMKRKLLKLRHSFDEDTLRLEEETESVKMKRNDKSKSMEILRLENLKKSLARKFEEQKNTIKYETNLLESEIDSGDDDSQKLSDDDELKLSPQKRIEKWVNNDYQTPNKDGRVPVSSTAYLAPRRPPSPQPSCSASSHGDKDEMMMNLMQAQLNLMHRSNVSYTEKKLPDFAGDPGEWGNFYAAYERSSTKLRLDDGENLSRLQIALKGEAKEAVKHLMSNPLNVPKIIESLRKRFGRAEFILDFLIEKIRQCPKPDISKPKTIVEFGTAVEDLVTNIVNYNEEEYLYSKQLVMELVEKLPGSLQGKWYSWLSKDESRKTNFQNFSNWIEKYVNIALLQMKPTVMGKAKMEEKSMPRFRKPQGSFHVSEGEVKVETDVKGCQCCQKKGHQLDSCWTYKKKSLDDRWSLAKLAKVCYACLKSGHMTRACTEVLQCGKQGCKRKHHPLLHYGVAVDNSVVVGRDEGKSERKNNDDGAIGVSISIIKGTDGPLPIVPIRIRGCNGNVIVTHALLDSGATRTLIAKQLAEELGLKGEKICYNYRTMDGAVVRNQNAKKVNTEIGGRFRNARMYAVTEAITVDKIGISPYSLDVEQAKRKWPHLRRYKGPSLRNVKPEMVIGGDNGYLLMHRELLYSTMDEPVAMRTVLGWTLQGKLANAQGTGSVCCVGGINIDEVLHDLIKQSFRFEDDKTGETVCKSMHDKEALALMESATVQRTDGRWETELLWKSKSPFPSSGYAEALKRLEYAERKMRNDDGFAKVYRNKIQEYTHKMYIRKLNDAEIACINGLTRYVSHFGVQNPNKPGKFRLVFDAAQKADGVSLNDRLYTGPDLLRSLPAILWNFRRHPFVVCGDIEDMFHRVYIAEKDQSSQRFLWRNGDNRKAPDVYVMQVMIFGATCSPSCAIFVKNKNAEIYANVKPAAVKAILEDMYCDDCLTGGPTVEEVIRLRKDISEINQKGGFIMKKWMSNSPLVMSTIPEDLRLTGSKPLGTSMESERVLGLWWNPVTDEFTFKLKFNKVNPALFEQKIPTKREVCSMVMSLYDPIGFIGQYKIKGMIILQHTWKSGVSWDDEIPNDVNEKWQKWMDNLTKLAEVKIPRCYSLVLEHSNVQLHTIVDASSQAFVAACYLRIQSVESVELAFVASSVKVAPLKKKTIPRLELDAAVLGTKLSGKIFRELKLNITSRYFWSDSSTVLYWIRSQSSRYKEYVANRIGRIQNETNISDWRWIPSNENVADEATRLDHEIDFSSESRWLRGPAFLCLEEKHWPKNKNFETEDVGVIAVATSEVVGDASGISPSSDEGCGLGAGVNNVIFMPKINKFSKYVRLVRATAASYAAAMYWMKRWQKTIPKSISPWELTTSGLQSQFDCQYLVAAEKMIIRFIQQDLKNWKKLECLSPFKDADGIFRVRGRLGNAGSLYKQSCYPILLPENNHVVNLIIDQEHRKYAHTGRNTVFNSLRQKYWILGGRHAVRKAWTRCQYCKIKKAKPVVPRMGDLPECRLQPFTAPFEYTGVDMFGPVEVTVGRRHEKRWGIIFTDMVTRGIHLDYTAGLGCDDTMLVLSRFMDIRGVPRHFYSDNGTNFVAVAKELQQREKFQRVRWHFIPPASPHMGGAWETMVKQAKRVLHNLLNGKFPREQVLHTALKAVENVVNSRPLSFVSGDLDDPITLTPNHFLRGVSLANDNAGEPACISGSALLGETVDDECERWGKLWEKAQVLANQFWKRWTVEVMPQLARRNKWLKDKDNIEEGDVVLMVDEQRPRNEWIKAVVIKTFPGKDNVVRVVEVAVRNFQTKAITTYKRAVAKVCPIGVKCDLDTLPQVPKSGGRK